MTENSPLLRLIIGLLVGFLCLFSSIGHSAESEPSLSYIGFGAQKTVSGSLHAIDFEGGLYLIDVGIFMAGEGENYPWPEELPPEQIEGVFITHAHADHMGRLPLLIEQGYSGPIYMTEVTYQIAKTILPRGVTLADFGKERFYYSKNNEDNERIPIYLDGYDFGRFTVNPENRVYFEARRPELDEKGYYFARAQRKKLQDELRDALADQSRIVDPGDDFSVGDARVQFIHTSHMPGSVMVSLSLDDQKLLFSGDVGGNRSSLLEPNPKLDHQVDYLWLEGTYSEPIDINAEQERDTFRRNLGGLVKKGHRVVIPSFVVDRTQQVLFEISQGIEEGVINSDTPVKVYSSTANAITRLYRNFANSESLVETYFSDAVRPGIFSMPGYEEPDVDWNARDPLNLSHGSIAIMSSGMAEHAYARRAIKDYGDDPSTSFYIVGYQAPGTPGRALRDGEGAIELSGKSYEINATTHDTAGFSGHADPDQMLDVYGSMEIGQLFLTHLDERNAEPLQRFYNKHLDVPVAVPEPTSRIELTGGSQPTSE